MYAGRIVETGTRDELFGVASHPYTQALLAAMGIEPGEGRASRTPSMPATDDLQAVADPSAGCAYRTRCPLARPVCGTERPELVDRGAGHPVACHESPPVKVGER
jgi:peptide/nickel transport system ATP-binding protein/oligopeptide transport system ATP-binding protein